MTELELLQGILNALNILIGLRLIEVCVSCLRSIRKTIIGGY